MGAEDEVGVPETFAGDIFLRLAADGRLRLAEDQADQLIADLEETLAVVCARVRMLQVWRRLSAPVLDDLDNDVEQAVVDTVFADQLAPGRLEAAMQELPKYVQALRMARGTASPLPDSAG